MCMCSPLIVEGEDFQSPSPLEVIFNVASPAVPLCVTFDILDDSDLEGDHSFTVQITGVGPAAVIASPDTTTVIIDDDDDEREHSFTHQKITDVYILLGKYTLASINI